MTFEGPQNTYEETRSTSEDLAKSLDKLQETLGANRESEIKNELSVRYTAALDRVRDSRDPRTELQQMVDDGFFTPTKEEEEQWRSEMPDAQETAQDFLNNVRVSVERDSGITL